MPEKPIKFCNFCGKSEDKVQSIFTAEKGINKMHDSNMKTIAGCPVLRVILFAATPISLQVFSILIQNRGLRRVLVL